MKRLGLILLTGSMITLTGLTSCGAPETLSQAPAPTSAEAGSIAEISNDVPPNDAAANDVEGDASPPASSEQAEGEPSNDSEADRPQLIKRARLSVDVDSVEDSFKQVRSIIDAQNGDVLAMQDYGDRERSLTFELRVPQNRLDPTLDALAELGEIRGRSIDTEDVSDQLVDLQARINNSRKSEAALQEIMSRSGEIADVLEVSRELSSVRQEIEMMSGLQKKLQTQVRYSTIDLSLQSAVALTPNKPGFSTQIATSWNEATESVGEFTTDLVQLGLWLLVYSPYLTLLICGAVAMNKLRSAASSSSS